MLLLYLSGISISQPLLVLWVRGDGVLWSNVVYVEVFWYFASSVGMWCDCWNEDVCVCLFLSLLFGLCFVYWKICLRIQESKILVSSILLILLLVGIFHSDDRIFIEFVLGPVVLDHVPFCCGIFFVHFVSVLTLHEHNQSWKTTELVSLW